MHWGKKVSIFVTGGGKKQGSVAVLLEKNGTFRKEGEIMKWRGKGLPPLGEQKKESWGGFDFGRAKIKA